MTTELTTELQRMIDGSRGEPVRFIDPRNGASYRLVREEGTSHDPELEAEERFFRALSQASKRAVTGIFVEDSR